MDPSRLVPERGDSRAAPSSVRLQRLPRHLFQRLTAAAVLILALCSFSLAAALPVYTDEITWSAILGRLNYDRGKSLTITLQPSCEGVYATTVAKVMWWPRWVDTYLVDCLNTPLRLRLWGVAGASCWMLFTWLLLRRLIPGRNILLAVLVAWSTLGVEPFLLVLSRPEHVLLLGTTVFLLLGLVPPPRPQGLGRASMLVLAILFGSWYVLASHPRALFIAPLSIVFAYRMVQQRSLRWILMGSIAVLTVLLSFAWRPLWSCSQDSEFARMLVFSNLATARALGMEGVYLHAQLQALSHTEGWFLKAFTPKLEYSSGIIPPFLISHTRVLRDVMEGVCAVLLLGGMLCCSYCVYAWTRRRQTGSSLLLLLSGWLIYFLNVFVRVQKNDYEAAYMQPLMGLLIVCSGVLCRDVLEGRGTPAGTMLRRLVPTLTLSVMLLSIVSQCALLRAYGRYSLREWFKGGQPRGQTYSTGIMNSDEVAAHVRQIAAQCSIDPSQPQHHLLVDESSYFVFRTSNEPLFAAYFDDRGWGHYRPDPTRLFQSLHSTGLITYCNRVPRRYAADVRGDGQLCCLPRF